MKNLMILALGLAIVLACGMAGAAEITIWDGDGTGSGWYGGQEDNEVEPGMAQNDSWDLEGMFIESSGSETWLYLVGTYDFQTGLGWNGGWWSTHLPGDLFVKVTTGEAYPINTGLWDDGTEPNKFGYNYALDWVFGSYVARSITNADLDPVNVPANTPQSNPWKVKDSSTAPAVATGNTSYDSNIGDYNGFTTGGGAQALPSGTTVTRNKLGFNITPFISALFGAGKTYYIPTTYTLTYHFTMECGNDNLMGQQVLTFSPNDPPFIVPEPASMTLLGLGLAGFAVRWARRRNNR